MSSAPEQAQKKSPAILLGLLLLALVAGECQTCHEAYEAICEAAGSTPEDGQCEVHEQEPIRVSHSRLAQVSPVNPCVLCSVEIRPPVMRGGHLGSFASPPPSNLSPETIPVLLI